MRPVEPLGLPAGARLVTFGKDQPEYLPLPAAIDANGDVLTEWECTAAEFEAFLTGGRLRIWVHTCHQPLQPLRVEVTAGGGDRRGES